MDGFSRVCRNASCSAASSACLCPRREARFSRFASEAQGGGRLGGVRSGAQRRVLEFLINFVTKVQEVLADSEFVGSKHPKLH